MAPASTTFGSKARLAVRKDMDFFLPMQARHWLAHLRDDPLTGIRIFPDLHLPPDELGFSFSSNCHGFRGGHTLDANNVLFGTSFAMGFAVNNGDNWHEHGLDASWLNTGLPVGATQIKAFFDSHYTGAAKTALLVYHPNFWSYARQYEKWAASGKGAFEHFGWVADRKTCFAMQLKLLERRKEKLKQGLAVNVPHEGETYFIDAQVCRFDFNRHWDVFCRALDCWRQMLARFEKVVVIRVPMKLEVCPERYATREVKQAALNYTAGWELTRKFLGRLPDLSNKISFFDASSAFSLHHYWPLDGHWNAAGNLIFASFVQSVLETETCEAAI